MKKSSSLQSTDGARKIVEEYPNDFSADLQFELRSFGKEFKKEIETKETVKDLIEILLESQQNKTMGLLIWYIH